VATPGGLKNERAKPLGSDSVRSRRGQVVSVGLSVGNAINGLRELSLGDRCWTRSLNGYRYAFGEDGGVSVGAAVPCRASPALIPPPGEVGDGGRSPSRGSIARQVPPVPLRRQGPPVPLRPSMRASVLPPSGVSANSLAR
jgi:hypothetical protein